MAAGCSRITSIFCWAACLAGAGPTGLTAPAQAQAPQASGSLGDREPPGPDPEDIVVYGRALEQVGVAGSASEGVVGYADFDSKPISRVGELAENVPGLIATQHSGTGKANQYFLRGFNLDHGTDFSAFVDGVPVNLRSHGHGQGYLDLNFIIPELIQRIDFAKGPYRADRGDFSLAGSASFATVRRLDRPFVEATAGAFGYYRTLAAGGAALGGGNLLAGLEGTLSNGPWVLDENLEKVNGLIRYWRGDWSLGGTFYHADWTSSDQVPLRAVRNGLIPRFGFVDPDLGGRTTRLSVQAGGRVGPVDLNFYAVDYRFRLTSNFTYFLDDPINGDEFQQRDRRRIYGGSLRHEGAARIGALPVRLRFGADLRWDDIGLVGLYRSTGGIRRETVREDRLDEGSVGLWGEAEFGLARGLRAIVGLRGEAYRYDVRSDLPANGGAGDDAVLLPKASLAWSPVQSLELYASHGEGFHSNDARGATIRVDPATGEPASRVPLLVRGRGQEIGARFESDRFNATLALFRLTVGSELVFVGDAGATEPNPPSLREGLELTAFWRPMNWLVLDGSASSTRARLREVPAGERRIPGAVGQVLGGGATAQFGSLSGTIRVRHFGEAPLIEDDSVRSDATTLVNLGAYYRWRGGQLALDLFNALGARESDISYLYSSRLPGEPDGGVDDVHFHPVEPRQVRASLRLHF
jgi:outer membrane receptor protein involved in Fe transport